MTKVAGKELADSCALRVGAVTRANSEGAIKRLRWVG